MLSLLRRIFRRSAPQPVTEAPKAPTVMHVFLCSFETLAGLEAYAFEHWAGEDAEPRCPFAEDLGIQWLDHDFLEIHTDDATQISLRDYLGSMAAHPREVELLLADVGGVPRQAILMTDAAFATGAEMRSTPHARYAGSFETNWGMQ